MIPSLLALPAMAPSGPPPRRSRGRWRWAPTALAAGGVAATLAFSLKPVVVLGFIFVAIVPFERMFPRHPQRLRRPRLGTDIAYALVSAPLTAVGAAVGLALSLATLAWLPGLLLRPLVSGLSPLPRALLGLILFDFVVYWAHRFGHEIPFLWRFHRIHHSTEHLDWVSGFRAHPLDGALLAPAFATLVVAGFSPKASGALAAAQVLSGLFLHANVRWSWQPLHRVLATPEFHHWHHSNEADAHSTNYAAFLPVWDIVFGTYFMPRSRRPAVYGVDGAVSVGIAGQLWDPFRRLRNPVPMLRHPVAAARELGTMLRRGLTQIRGAAGRRPAV